MTDVLFLEGIRTIGGVVLVAFLINSILVEEPSVPLKSYFPIGLFIMFTLPLNLFLPTFIKPIYTFLIIFSGSYFLYPHNIYQSLLSTFIVCMITLIGDPVAGMLMIYGLGYPIDAIVHNPELVPLLLFVFLHFLWGVLCIVIGRKPIHKFLKHRTILKDHQISLSLLIITSMILLSLISFLLVRVSHLTDINPIALFAVAILPVSIILYFLWLADRYLKQVNENKKLKLHAERDFLTQTLTRSAGITQIQSQLMISTQKNLPMLFGFVDMNNLKEINDQYGHIHGDQSILTLSNTLLKHLRAMDIVFRFGGDEFIFALPGCNLEKGQALTQNIKESLAQQSEILPYDISISVGLYEKRPEEKISFEDILQIIDQRMYENKKQYKMRYIGDTKEPVH